MTQLLKARTAFGYWKKEKNRTKDVWVVFSIHSFNIHKVYYFFDKAFFTIFFYKKKNLLLRKSLYGKNASQKTCTKTF